MILPKIKKFILHNYLQVILIFLLILFSGICLKEKQNNLFKYHCLIIFHVNLLTLIYINLLEKANYIIDTLKNLQMNPKNEIS